MDADSLLNWLRMLANDQRLREFLPDDVCPFTEAADLIEQQASEVARLKGERSKQAELWELAARQRNLDIEEARALWENINDLYA